MFAPDVALGIPVSMQEPGLGLGSSSAVPMSSMDQALMQMGHPAGPASALHAGMYEQPAGLPGSSAMLHGGMQSQVSLRMLRYPSIPMLLEDKEGAYLSQATRRLPRMGVYDTLSCHVQKMQTACPHSECQGSLMRVVL